MVDYMNLKEQVDADFGRARRQAFFGGLKTRFVGGRDRLLSFDEVRRALDACCVVCFKIKRRSSDTRTKGASQTSP